MLCSLTMVVHALRVNVFKCDRDRILYTQELLQLYPFCYHAPVPHALLPLCVSTACS